MKHVHQNRIQSLAFVMSACIAVFVSSSMMSSLRARETTTGQGEPIAKSRVNPNVAPIESLVRLPGLGVGRAGAIVAYRKKLREEDGKRIAFEDCNDLLKVRGIGPKTVQGMSEWVEFD
jgi:competence ComEA-like helix-hairpin-helix protein